MKNRPGTTALVMCAALLVASTARAELHPPNYQKATVQAPRANNSITVYYDASKAQVNQSTGKVHLLAGVLFVEVASGVDIPVPLTWIDLTKLSASDATFNSITGIVGFPILSLGALAGGVSGITEADGFELGIVLGSTLNTLPAKGSRAYLTFGPSRFAAIQSQGMKFGKLKVGMASTNSFQIALDPTDPALLVFADSQFVPYLSDVSPVTAGLSANGLLPFVPSFTKGVPDGAIPSFKGHLYLAGSIPLSEPLGNWLSVDGLAVVNIDPASLKNITLASAVTGSAETIGLDGELSLQAPFLNDLLSLTVKVGTGSANITIFPAGKTYNVALAGKASSDNLNSLKFAGTKVPFPILPTDSFTLAGLLNNTSGWSTSFLTATGAFRSKLSALNGQTNMPLMNDVTATGTFRADATGVSSSGTIAESMTASIKLGSGTTTFTESIPASNPGQFSVSTVGKLSIGGSQMGNGTTTLTRQGLSATVDVAIPLVMTEELQWVTDAAVCGTRTVTDGAVCGWDVLSSCATCAVSWAWGAACDCGSTAKTCEVADSCSKTVTVAPYTLGTVKGTVSVAVSQKLSGTLAGNFCSSNGGCSALTSTSAVDFNAATPRSCFAGIPGAEWTEICGSF